MPEECSVRFTRRYAEAPAEVWLALTEPESVGRWLRPGFPVPQTEVEPGRVLELEWRPPGEVPSVVRIEVARGPDLGAAASTLWSSWTPTGRGET